MLRLFDDSQTAHIHQHIVLTVDMVPSDDITKKQGDEILSRIKKVVADFEVPIMTQARIKSHQLRNCTVMECGGLAPQVVAADAEYHRRYGDEH